MEKIECHLKYNAYLDSSVNSREVLHSFNDVFHFRVRLHTAALVGHLKHKWIVIDNTQLLNADYFLRLARTHIVLKFKPVSLRQLIKQC